MGRETWREAKWPMAVMYPAILDTELSKEDFKVDVTFIHEVVKIVLWNFNKLIFDASFGTGTLYRYQVPCRYVIVWVGVEDLNSEWQS